MFEDSLMESGGQIKTKSRWWSLAAFALNGSILSILILIPLIYPGALPRQALTTLLVAPAPPRAAAPAAVMKPQAPSTRAPIEELNLTRFSLRRIPTDSGSATAPTMNTDAMSSVADNSVGGPLSGIPGALGSAPEPVLRAVVTPKKVAVSSGVAAGNLINRITPVYPAIAKAARVQGTVIVQATISKTGTIENARAISGPELLRQSAVEGVRSARYKPYLLNGEPVEVETTVNVIFNLGG